MMNSSKANCFTLSISSAGQIVNIFYFDEDLGNIVSLFNQKYEMESAVAAMNDVPIYIGTVQNSQYIFEDLVFAVIDEALKFKMIKFVWANSNHHLAHRLILSNENAIMGVFAANSIAESSLLPISKYHQHLWIKDIEYAQSPTFFVDTFTISLWCAFIISFVLIVLATFVIRRKLLRFNTPNWYSSIDCISLILGQGFNGHINHNSLKIILLTLGILLVCFYSAFGAFIDSLLVIKKLDLPFRNLAELYTDSSYSICAKYKSVPFTTLTFLQQNDPSFKVKVNIGCPEVERFNYEWILPDNYTCKTEKLVFIGPRQWQKFSRVEKRCHLTPLEGNYFGTYYSMVVSKSFQYREQFNRRIIKLLSSGIEFYLMEYKLQSQRIAKKELAEKIVHSNDPITFQQVTYVFLILLIGMCCSILNLTFEIFIKSKFL